MLSDQTIDFKLDAYLSSQNGGVSNSNIQKLFVIVNKRPVMNEDLYKAIKTTFKVKSALRQPIGVVYIQVPLGTIDFNVSADKTVARIQNESKLVQFISESYSHELDRETKERLTQQTQADTSKAASDKFVFKPIDGSQKTSSIRPSTLKGNSRPRCSSPSYQTGAVSKLKLLQSTIDSPQS